MMLNLPECVWLLEATLQGQILGDAYGAVVELVTYTNSALLSSVFGGKFEMQAKLNPGFNFTWL